MALHPGQQKRHFPAELPVDWDPIRRDLEEDGDWYRDLVEHSQDLLCVHDLTGRFLSVNPCAARALGYSVQELMRKPMRDLIDPQFRAQFDIYLREIQQTGESRGQLAVMTRSGEQRIWEYHNTLRTEGVPKPVVRGMAHDVTERVRAEKALRKSNAELLKTTREQEDMLRELTLFRTLLNQSNDAIKVVEPETLRILDVNERSHRELGYSREEFLAMTIHDIDPNIDETFLARVRQELQESGFAILERVHFRKDGTPLPVEVNLRRVQLDRDYIVSISRDITERKRDQERLREFERVVENLEEMIVVVDRDHRYLLANRAALRYRGLTKKQMIGRHVTEIMQPGLYETIVKAKLDESFAGHIVSYEGASEFPGMGRRDLASTYLPIEGPDGIDRVACVLRDITERNQAEKALRQSEARERARARELEAVLEAVPVPVFIAHDAGCQRITGNQAACDQLGISSGKNLSKSAPADEQPRIRVLHEGVEIPADSLPMQQAAARGEAVDSLPLTILLEDGTARETLMNAVPLLDERGCVRGAVGASIDMTRLNRAERALYKSEFSFRAVYERSPIGIAIVDSRTGRFLQANPKFCEITGRDEKELLRSDVAGITHPDDIGLSDEVLHQLADEELGNYELEKRYLRPDGSARWVRISVVPMWDKGDARRWQMGLVQDITERKQSEESIAALMQEVFEARKKLTEEKLYLEQEINTELGFGEIVGNSKALHHVIEQVGKVASSDATVLLLGETGTGKELVARAVHRLSQRASNNFIKVNCAAIPSGLLESELFGNEKGAFTGAISKKIGRIELADKGTLFLDEIGEIPLELQPKLLRVLQDGEFERLGGTQTLKVDFRLIAATNRNLPELVRENKFRSDLFYRLNVFPVRLPPLRDRRDDIRFLVEHFVQKFNRRLNKSITSIPRNTMDLLTRWDWPGNVRELENFIERSAILTQGSVLVSPLSELVTIPAAEKPGDESLEATERAHILRALRESSGRIGGLRGAAKRLGLKRTTLQSKLKHLGIEPRPPG